MADTIAAHELPVPSHVYQNHHFDSLRWNFVTLRDDDIVIATSYKAGTTWMQGIVANLIFSGRELPASLFDLSPWVDMRVSRLRHGQSPGGLTTAQPYAPGCRWPEGAEAVAAKPVFVTNDPFRTR